MSQTVPGSMRTRQSLSDLFAGRLSSLDGRAELVRLATQLTTGSTKWALGQFRALARPHNLMPNR